MLPRLPSGANLFGATRGQVFRAIVSTVGLDANHITGPLDGM